MLIVKLKNWSNDSQFLKSPLHIIDNRDIGFAKILSCAYFKRVWILFYKIF